MMTDSITLPDSGLMQMMWLASPALPVGGFSYSEGLECAVEQALVHDEAQTCAWLIDQLHLSLARSDLHVLAQVMPAWELSDTAHIQALNAWVLQTRETSELRAQTIQMGKSLLQWLHNHTTARAAQLALLSQHDISYPVAFALAASAARLPVRAGLLAYAFGWAENMVQAALKSMQLGQSAGQRILARLAAAIPLAADHAASLMDSERQAFSPMLAILSAQHEVQYSRLFRS